MPRMLDEATAAAEAMTLCHRVSKSKAQHLLVHEDCYVQTLDVLQTRAEPLGIELLIGSDEVLADAEVFGALLSYPGSSGELRDLSSVIEGCMSRKLS